jgi:uncharacterized protein
MSASVIDAFEFCRNKERLEGEYNVAELSRLAAESVDGAGLVRWALQGDVDKLGHWRLALSVSGTVRLMCQRCLTPFEFEVASESSLVLAQDEASADEVEELLADDSMEVIVGSKAFNIADLIEDEVLLAIPSSPKHEVCAERTLPRNQVESETVSPFAVLKGLNQ